MFIEMCHVGNSQLVREVKDLLCSEILTSFYSLVFTVTLSLGKERKRESERECAFLSSFIPIPGSLTFYLLYQLTSFGLLSYQHFRRDQHTISCSLLSRTSCCCLHKSQVGYIVELHKESGSYKSCPGPSNWSSHQTSPPCQLPAIHRGRGCTLPPYFLFFRGLNF